MTSSCSATRSPPRGSRRASRKLKASSLLRLAIEDLYPGPHRACVELRRGRRGAPAHGGADRRGDAGDLRRHRPAFSRDARLSRRSRARARADQRHCRRAGRRDAGAGGSGEVPVRQRSGPLLRNPQGPAARGGDGRVSTPGSPAARVSRRTTRATLPLFEAEGERIKINPLVGWSASDVLNYVAEAGLPRHPLVAKGFPSIGCLPCTSPVKPGEDERAGRWRGRGKIECGIHVGPLEAGSGI